jgi:hypothetical protein
MVGTLSIITRMMLVKIRISRKMSKFFPPFVSASKIMVNNLSFQFAGVFPFSSAVIKYMIEGIGRYVDLLQYYYFGYLFIN